MQTKIIRQANLLQLKYAIAKAISSDPIGWTLLRAYRGLIPHKGTVIAVGERNYKAAASVFWGLYESAELRFITQYWNPSLNTIELGSSIGVISSYTSSRLDRGVKLLCVEANPVLIETLRGNLARNQGKGTFELVAGAIHYSSPTIAFSVAQANLNSKISTGLDGTDGTMHVVNSIKLKDLVSKLGSEWYQLICDIEGAEVDILENDSESLARCGLLIIETHDVLHNGKEYNPDLIIDMIEQRSKLRLHARYGPVCVFTNEDCFDLQRPDTV